MIRTRRYVYTTTNKFSQLLLGVIVVAVGSLWVRYWAMLPPGYDWVLRVAWSAWSIAVVIRVFEALILRFALRQ